MGSYVICKSWLNADELHTVKLQCSIPHGPTRRAEECERQHGDLRCILKNSEAQTGAFHQCLNCVNCAHLKREAGKPKTKFDLETQSKGSVCVQSINNYNNDWRGGVPGASQVSDPSSGAVGLRLSPAVCWCCGPAVGERCCSPLLPTRRE